MAKWFKIEIDATWKELYDEDEIKYYPSREVYESENRANIIEDARFQLYNMDPDEYHIRVTVVEDGDDE